MQSPKYDKWIATDASGYNTRLRTTIRNDVVKKLNNKFNLVCWSQLTNSQNGYVSKIRKLHSRTLTKDNSWPLFLQPIICRSVNKVKHIYIYTHTHTQRLKVAARRTRAIWYPNLGRKQNFWHFKSHYTDKPVSAPLLIKFRIY